MHGNGPRSYRYPHDSMLHTIVRIVVRTQGCRPDWASSDQALASTVLQSTESLLSMPNGTNSCEQFPDTRRSPLRHTFLLATRMRRGRSNTRRAGRSRTAQRESSAHHMRLLHGAMMCCGEIAGIGQLTGCMRLARRFSHLADCVPTMSLTRVSTTGSDSCACAH